MTFCVECGAEGPVLDGLCKRDFARKHPLVRGPELIDVVRCTHCASLKTNGQWVEEPLEDVLPGLIEARAERDPRVERARYAYDLRPRGERLVATTVEATCRVGAWDLPASFQTDVRLRDGTCPSCSRRHGRYYVGTVQVRAHGRPLAADEIQRVADLVDRWPTRGTNEFVSRVETVRGGIDVLVSTNGMAKRLAGQVSRTLGGTVGSSASLHTRREGRDLYRATYIVRLPGFREGDVVEWQRVRYRVVTLGDPVRLEDVATGERVRVRVRELRRAHVIRGAV